jgi:trk system potassium uptake protein
MNIVIAGDSEVSLHLAKLLSGENHDVTLISPSHELLKVIESHSDLMTQVGDSTLVSVLKNANIQRADLLISAHLDGRLNLLTAILGKRMGARNAIAKVHETDYLTEECRNHYKVLA